MTNIKSDAPVGADGGRGMGDLANAARQAGADAAADPAPPQPVDPPPRRAASTSGRAGYRLARWQALQAGEPEDATLA